MRMNARMKSSWSSVTTQLTKTKLDEGLRELAESEIVVQDGAVLLRALIPTGVDRERFKDKTGFEALVNKIHVSDYLSEGTSPDVQLLQGVKYAMELAERLLIFGSDFRIVLSRDPESGEVTVRFFGRRPEEPWGAEDPDEYQLEDIVYWDV